MKVTGIVFAQDKQYFCCINFKFSMIKFGTLVEMKYSRLFKGSPQSTPHQDAELLGEEDPGDVLQTAMCQASQV